MKFSVDCSNYTGIISDSAISQIKEWHYPAGFSFDKIDRLIAGTQVPSVCNQQLWKALDAGLNIDCYVQLKSTDVGETLKQTMAMAAYSVEDLRGFFTTGAKERIYLGFEVNLPTGQSGISWIDQCKKAALKAGFKRVGIYTAKWWWNAYVINSQYLFTTMPLWYAHYDYILPTPESWREEGFGGWWKPAMKQYNDNVWFQGRRFDLNASP